MNSNVKYLASLKFVQDHQRSKVRQISISKGDLRNSLVALVSIGLVVCLITLLLSTSIFYIAAANGSMVGYVLGYVGGAFKRFVSYLSIPLWLLAWLLAYTKFKWRVNFDTRTVIPILVFLSYALIQLLTTEPAVRDSRIEMVLSIAPITLVALPLCHRKGCEMFWYGLIVAGIAFFMALLLSGQLFSIVSGSGIVGLERETDNRLQFGMDTITSASIMYQCVLAGVLWLLTYRRKNIWVLLILTTCFGLFVCGVMTGSKGPLLSLIAAIITFVLFNRKPGLNWLYLAVFGIFLYWFGLPLLDNYSGAITHLTRGTDHESRVGFYEFVINSQPTLFGEGVGAFAHKTGLIVGAYVHNSVLEAYYEMGIVGVALFLWVLVAMGRKLILGAKHDPVVRFILAYFVYSFILSLVSGSIFGDSEMWLALAFGCAVFVLSDAQANGFKTKKLYSRRISIQSRRTP